MPTIRCKHCRYRLDGLADNRCPECGEAFDPNDPATFDVLLPTRRRVIAIALIGVGLSGFVAVPYAVLPHLAQSPLVMAVVALFGMLVLPALLLALAWFLLSGAIKWGRM